MFKDKYWEFFGMFARVTADWAGQVDGAADEYNRSIDKMREA